MVSSNNIPRSERRFLHGLRFAAVASIIIIAAISVYAVFKFQNYTDDSQLVEKQNQIQVTLESLANQMKQAEIAQLRYLISDDAELYSPYYDAKRRAYNTLKKAKALTSNHAYERHLLDSAHSLMDERFLLLEQSARIDSISIRESDLKERLIYEGYSTSGILSSILREIQNHSEEKLFTNLKETKDSSREAIIFMVVSSLVAIIIVAVSFQLVFRQFRVRLLAEQDLLESRTLLAEGEQLSRSGSFKYKMASNRFIWSEGIKSIFGFDGKGYPNTMDEFQELVHPEDREKLASAFKDLSQTQGRSRFDFRIRRLNDGELRFIRIQNSVLEEDNVRGGLIMGSIQDTTDEELNRRKLLQLNKELRQSNTELERFAYAASHDLQEPLRKIRSFGERLLSKYKKETPGQEYVQRMYNASQRMQRLIDDLLTLSRVTQNVGTRSKVDLNEVLEEVSEDLSLKISENNAEIKVDQLPVLYGSQSQLHQLFQNLISNGLKFRKKDVQPRIEISSETVEVSDIYSIFEDDSTQLPTLEYPRYHKISLTDNGIGFEQENLDRIFQIFERLHGRSEYEGTGIGLAICQRIVENHHGVITAVGHPGEGSEFVIYLPESHESSDNDQSNHQSAKGRIAHAK